MSQQEDNFYDPIKVEVARISGEPSVNVVADEATKLSKGLMQMFGLDPRAAALVTVVDLMMIMLDIVSGATFVVIGVGVAAYVAFLVYKMQRKFFGDDHDASLIKAMIVGLLMAIPVPLTPILSVFCGIAGVVQLVRRQVEKNS
jgi:hypothetical protein